MRPHRLDPNRVRDGTLAIVEHVDSQPMTEPEKLAALLAATYAQRQSMVEIGGYAADIALVEKTHRGTISALHEGDGTSDK